MAFQVWQKVSGFFIRFFSRKLSGLKYKPSQKDYLPIIYYRSQSNQVPQSYPLVTLSYPSYYVGGCGLKNKLFFGGGDGYVIEIWIISD